MVKELKLSLWNQEQEKESLLSWLILNIVLEVLARATRQEKEIKGIPVEKEELKYYLYLWKHDHVHRKHIGIHNKIIRTNKFSKIAGYKISIPKYTVFLYISNE